MIIDNNHGLLYNGDDFGGHQALGDIAFGRTSPEARALFNKASELGYPLPSSSNQKLINKFLVDVKQAAGGNMQNIIDIRMYANDIPDETRTTNMFFDGLHWDNPDKPISILNSTNSRFPKKGYRGAGITGSFIVTRTEVDIINNLIHRNDLSCMWIWFDIVTTNTAASGISIFTQSRAVACVPKHTSTGGFVQMGGRGLGLTVPDGFNIYTAEIINGNVNAYINNVLGSTNTLSWGTDFQSTMLDLGANQANNFTVYSNSSAFPSTSQTLGGCIMYRSSQVNRNELYNAVLAYFSELQNL